MKKLILFLLLWPAFLLPAEAQRTLHGKISDAGGDPLPGAAIKVAGTETGFIADTDGFHQLDAGAADAEFLPERRASFDPGAEVQHVRLQVFHLAENGVLALRDADQYGHGDALQRFKNGKRFLRRDLAGEMVRIGRIRDQDSDPVSACRSDGKGFRYVHD